ncbi:50S ribosomal protein L25 [Planctomycetes bacterium MalM25]|nr:50S ribosomal protein L25 [Planctomycetes bacterium MalM25]
MSDTLQATRRDATGSRASRKLRAEGIVPAVLYGHKEEPQSLGLQAKELRKALAHKAKVIELAGDASGQAVVQAIQWDTFHRHLLHIDLLRVSKGEKVHVTVPLEIKGDAAGANEGGVVSMVVDHLELEAAPASIPEVLHIDVTELHLGGNLTAGQISDLPEGATLLTDESTVVITCVPPAGAPKLDGVAEEAGAPEVIGEKKEEDDE